MIFNERIVQASNFKEVYPVSCKILNYPLKRFYNVGESFNGTGLELEITFNNNFVIKALGTDSNITYSIDKFKSGDKEVTTYFNWVVNEINGKKEIKTVSTNFRIAVLDDGYVVLGIAVNETTKEVRRLTTSNDPNKLVNYNILEPSYSAKGINSYGFSEGDVLPIWSEMQEYNVIQNKIAYQKGKDKQFSRWLYDTVVKIPNFYIKKDILNNEIYMYITNKNISGFTLHPGSNCYFAKFNSVFVNNTIMSIAGYAPYTRVTYNKHLEEIAKKGQGWSSYESSVYSALTWIYLFDYCKWDSQTELALGNTMNLTGNILNTGGTVEMVYHTGIPLEEDTGLCQMQYRGIEDIYGNVWDFVIIFIQNMVLNELL